MANDEAARLESTRATVDEGLLVETSAQADASVPDGPGTVVIAPTEGATEGKSMALSSEFNGTHRVMFTGSNTIAYALLKGKLFPLIDLMTISYSTFREKYEVQTIGSSNVRGRTRGTRTVAGTLIFAATNEHPLLPLLRSGAVRSTFSGNLYPDELMPFDIILSFLSQNPDQYDPASTVASRVVLSGIDLGNESSTISIHQSNTESVMQFMALGLTPMIDASGVWPGQEVHPEALADPFLSGVQADKDARDDHAERTRGDRRNVKLLATPPAVDNGLATTVTTEQALLLSALKRLNAISPFADIRTSPEFKD
jgi:hypothetical protein